MGPSWKKQSRSGGALVIALVGTAQPAAALAPPQTPGDLRPDWSRGGRSIAFQSTRDGNEEIYRFDVETGRVVRLTEHPARDVQASWAPDGSRLVFASDRDRNGYTGRARHQLYVMDRDGSDARRLAETESADFMPRWSPDGEWIAFLSDRDGPYGVYVVPAEGGEARSLLPADFGENAGNPTWSPDGRLVAFDAPTETGYDVFSVDVRTGELENHTHSDGPQWWFPAWAPDGDRLLAGLFAGSGDEQTHQIFALDLETGARTAVTRPTPRAAAAWDYWPSWSPDGARVVFASLRSGSWRLWTVGADGTGERELPVR